MKPLVLVLAGISLAFARVAGRSPRSLRVGLWRLLVLACLSTTLVWGVACSGTDEDAAEPAASPAQPAPPAEAPPAGQTAAEAPATSAGAAEEVAMGFLEAYGAFDADRAITYLAPDADVSGLISSVGGGSLDGSVEAFRLLVSFLEAEGYEQILQGCDRAGTGEVTYFSCPFDFHAIHSDDFGLGPFSGSGFLLGVRDGKIVEASNTWATGEFSPQVWEPFAEWVAMNHPEDVEVMYTGGQSGVRLTEESIQLWDERSREYVEETAP